MMEGEMAEAKRKYVPAKTRFEATKRVLEVCHVNSAGFAEYLPGKTDRLIADEFGVDPGRIAAIRAEFVGKFAPSRHSPANQLQAELAEQRALIDALIEWASLRNAQPFRRPGLSQLDLKIVK
jgi:hypothetical protein